MIAAKPGRRIRAWTTAVVGLVGVLLTAWGAGCGSRSEETSGRFRADLRAYYGAPPVIPHLVEELGRGNCRSCHEQGLIYGGQVAVARPHPYVGECRQCHVEQRPDAKPPVKNTFVGLGEPERIPPAYPGAPPPIPHYTRMRSECLNCHGPRGHPELRTPHPRWTNCTQCHVPQEREVTPPVENRFAAIWEEIR